MSPLFQGRFGRMFRDLPSATFGADEREAAANLARLGEAMVAPFDRPKDGPDEEESGIPALYTYFGQFLDHDITFDPSSSLQRQNDPDALVDFRTPRFDLDSVYGRGPEDQPYMYLDGSSFLLGRPVGGGSDPNAMDLGRNGATPALALIGDPRNDENVIVSQLHGLFLRFHNRLVAENPGQPFAAIQQRLRFHYQYLIVNDFLPRIVSGPVLESLKKPQGGYDRDRVKLLHWRNEPFMPVEFSVAAYRFGHSMVRPGYRLNDSVLLPIFPVPSRELSEGLTGFRALDRRWGLDWGRFIDIDQRMDDGSDEEKRRRLQFAYKIDTSLTNPLGELPPSVTPHGPRALPARNLLRGWRLGLPSGQDVARSLGLPFLEDAAIRFQTREGERNIREVAGPIFEGNCPLWPYVLAEANASVEAVPLPVAEGGSRATPKLGPVGGRIVAEVVLGLLFGDPTSYLRRDPAWQPTRDGAYHLRDFVRYALGR